VEWKGMGKYLADDKSPRPNKHQSYLRWSGHAISPVDGGAFSRAGVDAGTTGR
jgi:hypothetical protein